MIENKKPEDLNIFDFVESVQRDLFKISMHIEKKETEKAYLIIYLLQDTIRDILKDKPKEGGDNGQ